MFESILNVLYINAIELIIYPINTLNESKNKLFLIEILLFFWV